MCNHLCYMKTWMYTKITEHFFNAIHYFSPEILKACRYSQLGHYIKITNHL